MFVLLCKLGRLVCSMAVLSGNFGQQEVGWKRRKAARGDTIQVAGVIDEGSKYRVTIDTFPE